MRPLYVVLRTDEEGFVVAECPAIQGCFTQGRSREEALTNIEDVLGLLLPAGSDIPPLVPFAEVPPPETPPADGPNERKRRPRKRRPGP